MQDIEGARQVRMSAGRMGLVGAILLVMAVAGLVWVESPFVAEFAAFSARHQEEPPT